MKQHLYAFAVAVVGASPLFVGSPSRADLPAGSDDKAVPEKSKESDESDTGNEDERPIAVSVLPFAVSSEDGAIGDQVADLVTVLLSADRGFRLVDRQTLDRVLDEQALSGTGLVDTQRAIEVGNLVGAQIIVAGRVFELGRSRMMTAKLIGTETTLIEGVIERAPLGTPSDEMVLALGEQIVGLLAERGHTLVARPTPPDPTDAMIRTLAGRDLPTFAVLVTEEDLTPAAAASAEPPDPAVETDLKSVLARAGVDVRDVPANDLAEWAQAEAWTDPKAWPRTLDGVDYVLTGKAFSEPTGRMRQLHLAGARAEINVIQRRDGRIVLAAAETTRGVDLSPGLAGKNALEAAGRNLSIRLLAHLIETTEPGNPDAPEDEAE
ncbi:MAG: CsgG/HfaB family protein [Planctomycetota bacterium]